MKRILIFLTVTAILTGCKVLDPSVMLQTPEGYQFAQIPDSIDSEYRIAPNDIVQFRLFSNDGFKLIDVLNQETSGGGGGQFLQTSPTYNIEVDGTAKLPILGRTILSGLTLREAELFLEERYSEFYNSPYIIIQVSNRRVIVFPGQSGKATVVALKNDNTTLLEALALVGGLGNDAKAAHIKLIRGDKNNPEVYHIDLSTINGMKDGGMVLQANDIIYVEPRVNTLKEIVTEIQPVVQLFSVTSSVIISFVSLIILVQNLK